MTCLPLSKRLYNHKKECERDGSSQRQLFVLAREHGWSHFHIRLIEPYPCDDSEQLRMREQQHARAEHIQLDGVLVVAAGRPSIKRRTDRRKRRTGPNKSDNSFWILGAGWGWLSQNPPFYIYSQLCLNMQNSYTSEAQKRENHKACRLCRGCPCHGRPTWGPTL
jgi:hypothetical protein